MTQQHGPFKLFQVRLEETLDLTLDLVVRARSEEDARAVSAVELVDGICTSDWESDGRGPSVWAVNELEPHEVAAKPEVWCAIGAGGTLLTEEKVQELIAEWLAEKASQTNPNQLSLAGVDPPEE